MDFRVTAFDLSLSNAFKVGHCCGIESNEWNVHYRLVENKRVILYFFYKLKMKIYELWNGLLLCVSACRSRIEFRCHPAVIGPNTNLERRSCRMLYTTGSRWWSVTGTISDVKTLVFIFLLLNSRSRWLHSGVFETISSDMGFGWKFAVWNKWTREAAWLMRDGFHSSPEHSKMNLVLDDVHQWASPL